VKIAVDAMGGDFAPGEIVKGALLAAKEYNQPLILVGDEVKIRAEMGLNSLDNLISIVHAPRSDSDERTACCQCQAKKKLLDCDGHPAGQRG
jgi:fatty acid/phospholipid biosynthesis enzyme